MTVRRVVVDHMLFVVADLDASRGLYTAALAPLGYEELYVQDDCVSYGAEDLDDFTICRGEPVTTAAHVAFSAEGRDAVDAFFGAAAYTANALNGDVFADAEGWIGSRSGGSSAADGSRG